MEKKIALLIDAENISSKYLDDIFDELKQIGTITYKRMYGDFTNDALGDWNRKALEYAVVTIQQPRYSKAKNAADIMLVIDAMDILHEQNVDAFCIVSSDSDFTRLVNRLCEGGMEVIGMGMSNASKTLKAACTIYKNLEMIFEEVETDKSNKSKNQDQHTTDSKSDSTPESNIEPKETIYRSMLEIIREDEDAGKKTGLGGLKSNLQRIYKDFDERNYGYSSMVKFVKDMEDFEIQQNNSTVYVVLKNSQISERQIHDYIVSIVQKGPMELGPIGNQIHKEFPKFNVKDYGYSQLGKFLEHVPDITVTDGKKGKTVKYTRGE